MKHLTGKWLTCNIPAKSNHVTKGVKYWKCDQSLCSKKEANRSEDRETDPYDKAGCKSFDPGTPAQCRSINYLELSKNKGGNK